MLKCVLFKYYINLNFRLYGESKLHRITIKLTRTSVEIISCNILLGHRPVREMSSRVHYLSWYFKGNSLPGCQFVFARRTPACGVKSRESWLGKITQSILEIPGSGISLINQSLFSATFRPEVKQGSDNNTYRKHMFNKV